MPTNNILYNDSNGFDPANEQFAQDDFLGLDDSCCDDFCLDPITNEPIPYYPDTMEDTNQFPDYDDSGCLFDNEPDAIV